MTEPNYTEEETFHRDHIMRLIYEHERKFFYTFAYGSAFIFFYLIKAYLEPGILLGITTLISVLSVYFWLSTNPWWCINNVSAQLVHREPEDLMSRYEQYRAKAKKLGIASYVLMAAASWYFIWQ